MSKPTKETSKCLYRKLCLWCKREIPKANRKIKYCSKECLKNSRYFMNRQFIRKNNIRIRFNLTEEKYDELTKKCFLCNYSKIVDLHHINGKEDNDNLIALCPNHHRELHYNLLSKEQTRKIKRLLNK